MKKILLLGLMLLGMGGVKADDVITPIALTGGEGMTVEYLDANLEVLATPPATPQFPAKFTPTGDFKRIFRYENFNVGDNDAIVVEFGGVVPNGWNINGYVDGNNASQSFESIAGYGTTENPKYVMNLKGLSGNIVDFTIFNWMGSYDPIIVKDVYFIKYENARVSISNSASITETLESNPENFIEITQENVETGFTAATAEAGNGYTTYTATGNLQFAIKSVNVDVAGCDYVIFKFAEAAPSGWCVAFWEGQTNEQVSAGATDYKLVFSEDPHKNEGVKNGVLPQLTLMSRPWGNDVGTISIKVAGVYKHLASDYSRTYSFDKALDFTDVEGLEAYVITAFTPATATLTLQKVTKVPANTGLYLVGKGGDYEIPVIESADAITTNLLKASSDTDALQQTEGDYTNLIFGGTGENRGFHPLSEAGIIGANKAYLQLTTAEFNNLPASSRLNLVIDEEKTTDINAVNEIAVVDDAWYTISGVKLDSKPTQKGIYINKGKKFAIQ